MKTAKTKTPWGVAQTVKVIAPGIVFYSTATHGGYYLDEKTNERMPDFIKAATFGQQGFQGWYEEDLDWAFVVLVFQENFDLQKRELAAESVKQYASDVWNSLQGSA